MGPQKYEQYGAIAAEIIRMAQRDQAMRRGKWDDSVDKANTKRLKTIIDAIGWPTIPKVGHKASHMAWLLAQHADHDVPFQRGCLRLLKRLVHRQVIDDSEIAYLDDRVRVNQGKLQRYGTQFVVKSDGTLAPRRIWDMKRLDQRRRQFRMEPFSAYTRGVARTHALFSRSRRLHRNSPSV